MKNNFKETIEFCGLSYKKEISKLILITSLILLLIASTFLFVKEIYISIIAIFFGIIGEYLFLNRYPSIKRRILLERENEFVSLISYFKIFINNNNNVYHCFELLLPYCSTWMEEKIKYLLQQIDVDKTVTPFINFANNFNSPIFESVMLNIYQMIDQGETNNQMNQFSFLFMQLSKNYQTELIEKIKRSLDSMNAWPLIGAGSIVMILTFSILSIMGNMIDVL